VRKDDWSAAISDPRLRVGSRGDLPDGLFCKIAVQPSLQKYFAFAVGQIKFTTRPVPPRSEGRTRRHERWVRDAMDAVATQDERRWRGRRSRVVLAPRRWRQVLEKQSFFGMTVATKPGHREEHEGNR